MAEVARRPESAGFSNESTRKSVVASAWSTLKFGLNPPDFNRTVYLDVRWA